MLVALMRVAAVRMTSSPAARKPEAGDVSCVPA
jgi:hypothetical protein